MLSWESSQNFPPQIHRRIVRVTKRLLEQQLKDPSTENAKKAQHDDPEAAEFAEFASGLLDALSLHCPNSSCRMVLDPEPDGCARVRCRHCNTQLCWVCFDFGWDSKEGVYRHLERHRFQSGLPYYPGKEEVHAGHTAVRVRQIERYLSGKWEGVGNGNKDGHAGVEKEKDEGGEQAKQGPTRLERIQASLVDRQTDLLEAVQLHVPREEIDVRAIFKKARTGIQMAEQKRLLREPFRRFAEQERREAKERARRREGEWVPPYGYTPPQNVPPYGYTPPQNAPPYGYTPPQNAPPYGYTPPQNTPPYGYTPPQNVPPYGYTLPQNVLPVERLEW